MIHIRNLQATTRAGKTILETLHFSIEKSRVVGVFGPNGSGKSTFLKAAAGVAQANFIQGSVSIDGTEILNPQLQAHERVRKVLYLGSDFSTPFDLSVKDLFELGVQVNQRTQGSMLEVVESLRIQEFLPRSFHTLSDGEKQLMMFARAIIQRTDVYVFDETFSKLDLDKLILVSKVIRELASQGAVVLIASHDLNFLTESADEFLFLKQGRAVVDPPIVPDVTRAVLEHLYPELSLHVVLSPDTGKTKVLY